MCRGAEYFLRWDFGGGISCGGISCRWDFLPVGFPAGGISCRWVFRGEEIAAKNPPPWTPKEPPAIAIRPGPILPLARFHGSSA